jgi:hypothetical protein
VIPAFRLDTLGKNCIGEVLKQLRAAEAAMQALPMLLQFRPHFDPTDPRRIRNRCACGQGAHQRATQYVSYPVGYKARGCLLSLLSPKRSELAVRYIVGGDVPGGLAMSNDY